MPKRKDQHPEDREQRQQGGQPGREASDRKQQAAGGAADPVHNPPPPEATNFAHPDAVGSRTTAPGAGIIETGHIEQETQAPGLEHFDREHVGDACPGLQNAPGARRPGTTSASRPAAIPSAGGEGIGETAGSRPTEVASQGGTEPLSPRIDAPSQSAGPAARETSDPNFSAAHPDRTRPRRGAGADMSRMDTSGHAAPIPGGDPMHPRVVRDVMTADLEVCNPNTQIYYVARMMMERDIGMVPVVESTDTMRPVGTLTDRDIVTRCIAKNHNPLNQRASDCMTAEVVSVTPETPIEECVRQMEEKQIRRMLVTDQAGRLCGIVAQADIAETAQERVAAELLKEVSEPSRGESAGT